MSARTWAGSTVTAIGVAAGAGAAQLGVAYGLGIVAWLPVQDQAGKIMWQASLAWVVWIAATSTAIGAMFAHWLAPLTDSTTHQGFLLSAMRTTLALGAAVGALVAVPLVAVPARAADSPLNFAPEWTAAGYAGVGVFVGLAVTLAALHVRAIAANIVASVAYLWVLAVLAVVSALRAGTEPLLVQLAIWKFSKGPMLRDFYVPGVLLMLAAAVIIGFLASWPAGRRGDNRIGVATSGAVGPLLVAAAYLLAAPQFAGTTDVDTSQWSAHLFAPYAVIAGLAGSVLVAALGPKLTPEEKQERAVRAAQRRAEQEAARAAAAEAKRQAAEVKQQAQDAKRLAAGKPADEAPSFDDLREPPTDDLPARPAGAESAPVPAATKPAATKPASTTKPASITKPVASTPIATKSAATTTATTGPAPPATTALPARPGPGLPAPPTKSAENDLPDDGYAPARAYRDRRGTEPDPDPKAYASDTVEPGGGSGPAKSETSGRPETRAPLWPKSGGDTGEGKPPKGRRPRR